MLDALPKEVWFDPLKTWFEPSAGDGNFLVEIKARLLQAGHSEKHILENMLYSVELMNDNHWKLQHRLGYLIDGQLNPILDQKNFTTSKVHPMTLELNSDNPYTKLGLAPDEVLHHRNHVCHTALEYDMSFGRPELINAAKWFQPYALLDLPEELLLSTYQRAEQDAPNLKDKPDLPPRSLEKKIEDTLVGYGAEARAQQIGLTRDSNKYKDYNGSGFLQDWLNRSTEWKTINRPTIPAALAAMRHSHNKAEYFVIWYCDRVTMTYYPFAVFERGNDEPIVVWPAAKDLGEWPETDTPDIVKKLPVEKPVKVAKPLPKQEPVKQELVKQEPVKEPSKPEPVAPSSKFMKKIPGATGLLQF